MCGRKKRANFVGHAAPRAKETTMRRDVTFVFVTLLTLMTTLLTLFYYSCNCLVAYMVVKIQAFVVLLGVSEFVLVLLFMLIYWTPCCWCCLFILHVSNFINCCDLLSLDLIFFYMVVYIININKYISTSTTNKFYTTVITVKKKYLTFYLCWFYILFLFLWHKYVERTSTKQAHDVAAT